MSGKATNILFVCTGNTCRSPMAEGIARKLLADQDVNIFSAGVAASEGASATPEAITAAQSLGADISGHRSLHINAAMIEGADMIFALTASHRRAIVSAHPTAETKTFLLDPSGADIPDPIGFPQDVYDQTARTIMSAIEQRAGLIAGN